MSGLDMDNFNSISAPENFDR